MIYKLPIGSLKKVQSCIMNFLWTGCISKKPPIAVAWQTVCTPKSNGGLGLRNIIALNKVACLKNAWSILNSSNPWSRFFKTRFNTAEHHTYKISSIWPNLKDAFSIIHLHHGWIVGNGNNINLWHDNWLGSTLHSLTGVDLPAPIRNVCLFIQNNQWHIPPLFSQNVLDIATQISSIILPSSQTDDVRIWPYNSSGTLLFKDAYEFFSTASTCTSWSKHLWKSFIPPRLSVLAWRVLLGKLPTMSWLYKLQFKVDPSCTICNYSLETVDHLFLDCHYATSLWRWIFNIFHMPPYFPNFVSQLWSCIHNANFSPQICNISPFSYLISFGETGISSYFKNTIYQSLKTKLSFSPGSNLLPSSFLDTCLTLFMTWKF